MKQEFLYRTAELSDVDQLRDLALASYGQYFPQLQPQYKEELKTSMGNIATWGHMLSIATGYLCIAEGNIVGMAFIIPSGNPWDIFKAEWSYIRAVGIHPDYEGKGIAKALTRLCIRQAITLGERTIALHTSEMMPAARHIYEKVGFKQQYEIPPRLGKRYWIYTLDLEAAMPDKKLQQI